SAAAPVKETIKRVQNSMVVATLDRSHLALLQTPQVFDRARLEAAYDSLPPEDDPPTAVAVALIAGLRIATFPAGPDNLTVTTPADLLLAEQLLRARFGP